jgi:ribosomal protein S1
LQTGSEKVQVADVVSEGEEVWVKVIAVDVEAQKISLSMKYVDQASGKDMDPYQVDVWSVKT